MYIHKHNRLTAQGTGVEPAQQYMPGNIVYATEPAYTNIPPGVMRRMGKASRIAVGTAQPLLTVPVAGVVIGTANGGMEDSVKFLDQVITYEEGLLTPTNFVQSTSNAIASQIALLARNQGYNMTHTQRGLAFENSLLDAMMLVEEHNGGSFLVGGVDEISSYNFNIDRLRGWFKQEPVEPRQLYHSETPGSIAGEGCAMFIVSNRPEGAMLKVERVETIDTDDLHEVAERMQEFKSKVNSPVDLVISGENGDIRLKDLYNRQAEILQPAGIVRYKHITGDYATASAIALSIACDCVSGIELPQHMLSAPVASPLNIVICNTFEGRQHSIIHVRAQETSPVN
jgi:hypothetical protein